MAAGQPAIRTATAERSAADYRVPNTFTTHEPAMYQCTPAVKRDRCGRRHHRDKQETLQAPIEQHAGWFAAKSTRNILKRLHPGKTPRKLHFTRHVLY